MKLERWHNIYVPEFSVFIHVVTYPHGVNEQDSTLPKAINLKG